MAEVTEKASASGLQSDVALLNILQEPFRNVRRRYRLQGEIGRGEFGIIYTCTDVITGEQYACKSIRKSNLKSKLDVEDVQREVQVMERLKGHPAIIGIKATFEDEKVNFASRHWANSFLLYSVCSLGLESNHTFLETTMFSLQIRYASQLPSDEMSTRETAT